MENQEVSTNEILEFLQDHMVTKEEFKSEIGRLDTRIDQLGVKVNQTKLDLLDAMDEKLGSLKGDLVVMMRNEDKKLLAVVQKLKQKKIFDDHDVDEILNMIPFPQLVRVSS